jgi:murein DD-endopeptidase MepM/ murein hydrolase activator NlpD
MDFPRIPPDFTRRQTAISILLLVLVYALVVTAPAGPTSAIDGADPGSASERAALWVPGRAPSTTLAPPIWVGSPVTGTWGNAGRTGSTPAGGHHLLGKTSPPNQWAVDLPVGSGTPVFLYAAAADPASDPAVTAAITQIVDNEACIQGGGGDFVTVGIFYHSTLVGHVTYAHLDRDPSLQVGASVPRWGTTLGKVANLRGKATGGSRCWTGPHVHFELRAQSQQACWNRGQSVGRKIRHGDSMGFVSGALGSKTAPCP